MQTQVMQSCITQTGFLVPRTLFAAYSVSADSMNSSCGESVPGDRTFRSVRSFQYCVHSTSLPNAYFEH